MKKTLYISILLIALLIACKSDEAKLNEQINKEISELTTFEKKKEYLENIFNTHIDMRKQETEYWNEYGRNSDEYNMLVGNNRSQDLIDMDRIEKYLGNYGYPSIMKFGYQCTVIPIVQAMQINEVDVYQKNYKYFYDAYKFNDISAEIFLQFLRKLERKKYRNQYTYVEEDDPIEEKIETIISELRLNK